MATAEGTKNMEIYEKDLPDTEISKKYLHGMAHGIRTIYPRGLNTGFGF